MSQSGCVGYMGLEPWRVHGVWCCAVQWSPMQPNDFHRRYLGGLIYSYAREPEREMEMGFYAHTCCPMMPLASAVKGSTTSLSPSGLNILPNKMYTSALLHTQSTFRFLLNTNTHVCSKAK